MNKKLAKVGVVSALGVSIFTNSVGSTMAKNEEQIQESTSIDYEKEIEERYIESPQATLRYEISKSQFNTAVPARTAQSIRFERTAVPAGVTITDISSTGDGSVVVYEESSGNYVVTSQSKDHKIIFPNDSSSFFGSYSQLQIIEFGDNIDTSNVTTMFGMFDGCRNLTSLDLSSFDTGNVTTMAQMFMVCRNLTSLDLSSFDTSNVTSMYTMFWMCNNLTSLDLSSFDTSNVMDMDKMFDGCSNLTSLDLSNFDTSNVVDMSSMFRSCSSLTSLNLSNFDTSNIGHVGGMEYMFEDCSSLTSLNLSNFDTSGVTDMRSMFKNCSSLANIYAGSWDTSKVTYDTDMFLNCTQIVGTSLDGMRTNYDANQIGKSMATPNRGYFTAITVTLDKEEYVYDGTAKEPEVSVQVGNQTLAAGTDYDVVYANNTNVGEATVTVTITAKENYAGTVTKTFTITKALSTISINDDLNKEYDGQAVEEPKDIVKTGSTGAVRIEWYTADGTKLDGAPINAGEYKVKAILAEDANYSGAEVEREFSIHKANQNLSVTANPSSISINGTTTLVVEGAQGSLSYVSSDENIATVDANGVITGKAEGAVTITVSATETENYLAASETVEITVNKVELGSADANVTVTLDKEEYVYDGTAKEPGVSVQVGNQTLVAGTDYDVTYTNNTNAGEATVTVTGKGNYAGTVTKTFTITKALSTISINDDLNKEYNGQAVEEPKDIVKTGSTGAVSIEWYTLDGTKLDVAPVNAGEYKVKAILTEDANYNGAEVEREFTIQKANQNLSVTANPSSISINGTTTLTMSGAQGNISYVSSDETIATVDANGVITGKAEGTVTITVSATETENYLAASETVEITVSKVELGSADANVTVTLDKEEYVYDGTAKEPGVSVQVGNQTLVAGTDYDVTYTNNTNAGEATVTVTGKGNYAGTVTKTFTITKASTSIEITSTLDKEYDGQPVVEPTVNVTGNTNKPTIEWYQKEETTTKAANWKKLSEAPREIGEYKVVVSVAEDTNYTSATVEKEFTISKVTNVPEEVPTPGLGGTVVNPDDSTITVTPDDKIESNGPVTTNPDGSITFPNGGTVTKPDGTTETIQPGGSLNPTKPEEVPTPGLGGTIVNPDDSTITVTPDDKIESNGPITTNPDGSITFPNGGTVIRPDGTTEIIQPEGVLTSNISEEVPTPPTGGTTTNPDGSTGPVVNPGDKIESNGPIVTNPDGSITFPNGGTVTRPDGTTETIQPGGILKPGNSGDESIVVPEENIEGVQTGDSTKAGLWSVLVGISTGFFFIFRKKKQEER